MSYKLSHGYGFVKWFERLIRHLSRDEQSFVSFLVSITFLCIRNDTATESVLHKSHAKTPLPNSFYTIPDTYGNEKLTKPPELPITIKKGH